MVYIHSFCVKTSVTVTPVCRLCGGAALAEAQDINLYLKPLRSHFEEIEQADFEDLQKHLDPMMHVVCLVWANSKYYNTPARIIILLQEICNLIIALVSFIGLHHFSPPFKRCLISRYKCKKMKSIKTVYRHLKQKFTVSSNL